MRERVHAAGAEADAALARFDAVVLNAIRETETVLAVYEQDLRRDAELRAARDLAAAKISEVRALQRAGRSPLQAWLLTERSLSVAEAALAASESRIAADQIWLILALGGGWRGAPAVATEAAAPPSPGGGAKVTDR